jgi:hypothetical protein
LKECVKFRRRPSTKIVVCDVFIPTFAFWVSEEVATIVIFRALVRYDYVRLDTFRKKEVVHEIEYEYAV